MCIRDRSYIERANFVLSKFLTDFTEEEIAKCTEGAYGGEKFSSDKVAPLVKINDSQYILELWHGPTCACLLYTSAVIVLKTSDLDLSIETLKSNGVIVLSKEEVNNLDYAE